MGRVAIVDYGLCNLDSVKRAVEECGSQAVITHRREDLETASHIILPGVGAFGEAMKNIRQAGLDVTMREQVIENGIPFLGICLGMQLLARASHEHGLHEGLGWIDGEVCLLETQSSDERVPHMGWNEIDIAQDSLLLDKIPENSDFYFVHSYHFAPSQRDTIVAETPYCGGFVSMVQCDHIFGVQFHPEKSQRNGFQLLRNFLAFNG